jgi:hypothetical protein
MRASGSVESPPRERLSLQSVVPGQLATRLPAGAGLVVSATHEIEYGARSMLLLVDDLFRLDGSPTGDTVQLLAKNLSPGRLSLMTRGYASPVFVPGGDAGELTPLRPGHLDAELMARLDGRLIVATVTIATVRRPQRGTISLTTQAILRVSANAPAGSRGSLARDLAPSRRTHA